MSVRYATTSDLGAMTWVLVAASAGDPIYPFRYPRRDLFREDYEAHCRLKCAEYLRSNTVLVYEHTSISDNRGHVIAFAVWDEFRPASLVHSTAHNAEYQAPQNLKPTEQSRHSWPHTDQRRETVFREACVTAKAKYFDERFSQGHMFLRLLLCHPTYQRQGAGTTLTCWGIRESRKLGLATTLFSSPMGSSLYRRLGFTECGSFRIQVDGDPDFLEIPAMVLLPPGEKSRMQGKEATELNPTQVKF